MGQAEPPPRRYTSEEYFALEAQSEEKHEYFEGEVFAMAGTSMPHNLVKGNMVAALRAVVRKRGCRLFDENVRLVMQEGRHYTYPDIIVTCDPADRRETHQVRQPVLIVKVLSPGTQDYDRTEKFGRYQKLPSLRHYVLVSQAAWTVEWFRRDEAGQWIYTLLNDSADVLEIPDLGLVLPLAELYDDTDVARCGWHQEPAKAASSQLPRLAELLLKIKNRQWDKPNHSRAATPLPNTLPWKRKARKSTSTSRGRCLQWRVHPRRIMPLPLILP